MDSRACINRILFFVLILATFTSCQQKSESEAEIAEIENLISTFNRNFQNQDIDSLILTIDEDVRFFVPGIGQLKGLPYLISYIQKDFQTRSYTYQTYTDTIYISNHISVYREEQIGQIDDLEAGMSYPLMRHAAFLCTRDSLGILRIFEYTFVEKD